jgi:hypothetical protein
MYIWNELSLPTGKKAGYEKMVGAEVDGSAAQTLYVPLEFWFCRNVGLALPLIALQYHEVKVNIDFETKENCLKYGNGPNNDFTASLWVDYIFLDTDERRRFAQLSHEYLIEQLQFTGDESISGPNNRIKLNFNHPVKELVWIVQRDDVLGSDNSNEWTNYSTSGSSSNITEKAKLQLNGHDRFAERAGSYFNLVQPFQHHENVPSNVGINVYSFALKPEEHQPSGTLNLSRIDTAVLNLTTSEVTATATAKVKVFAVNYNVLRRQNAQKSYTPRIVNEEKRLVASGRFQLFCNTPGCGKLSRAFATTCVGKPSQGPRLIAVPKGNNAKDETIRRRLPTSAMVMDMEASQRLQRCGSPTMDLTNPNGGLRYSPTRIEIYGNSRSCPVWVDSRTQIRRKNEIQYPYKHNCYFHQACFQMLAENRIDIVHYNGHNYCAMEIKHKNDVIITVFDAVFTNDIIQSNWRIYEGYAISGKGMMYTSIAKYCVKHNIDIPNDEDHVVTSIDHINRVPRDNRISNLRYVDEPTQQANRKRHACRGQYSIEMNLPRGVTYIHPSHGHGERFEAKLKNCFINNQYIRWKTTSSSVLSRAYKLEEIKKYIRWLMSTYPDAMKSYSPDEYHHDAHASIDEYNDIIRKTNFDREIIDKNIVHYAPISLLQEDLTSLTDNEREIYEKLSFTEDNIYTIHSGKSKGTLRTTLLKK